MGWRRFAAAALALALLAPAAGCRPDGEGQPPVRITLMHGWGGVSPDHLAMRAIYDDFALQNPDVALEYDASPDISMVLDKADDLLAAGRVPNIVSTNGYGDFVANMAARGRALDLAPYLAEDPAFAANVGPGVLDTLTGPGGAVYTLPDALEVLGYWYNEEILRAAGVTRDGTPNTPARLPETFGELWNACDRIAAWAERTGSGVTPVILDPDQALVLMGARIAANSPEGAAFLQARAGRCPAADLEAAMDDLARAHSYYKGAAPSVNDTRQYFFSGKSAFYFNGVWAGVTLDGAGEGRPIRCAAYPGEYGQRVAYVSPPTGYVIENGGSPREIDACVRFLKYMLSEPVQRRVAAETFQVPSNPRVDAAWIAGQRPALGRALEACCAAEVRILTLRMALQAEQMDAVSRYVALAAPGEADRAALLAACAAADG